MAQKVITVHANTNTLDGSDFKELEFPEVNRYLSEGYSVTQILPVNHQNQSTSFVYSLTFILTKPDESTYGVA